MRAAPTLLATKCLGLGCLAVPIQSIQSIAFADCPTALAAPGMQCGSLKVPVDWEDPSNGTTITLGISKIPARDPSVRIHGHPRGLQSLTVQATHRASVLQPWRPRRLGQPNTRSNRDRPNASEG